MSQTETIVVKDAAEKKEQHDTQHADRWETCVVCGNMTEANPRKIAVRETTFGKWEASAFICMNCLKDGSRSWKNNDHTL